MTRRYTPGSTASGAPRLTPAPTPQEMIEQKPIDIEAETQRMLAGMFNGSGNGY